MDSQEVPAHKLSQEDLDKLRVDCDDDKIYLINLAALRFTRDPFGEIQMPDGERLRLTIEPEDKMKIGVIYNLSTEKKDG